MYYKSHTCTRRPNAGRRGRQNAKAYHFHNRPKPAPRKPEVFDFAVWRIFPVVMESIWCQFDKPWVPPDGKKKVNGRRIIRHIVTLEHFRGEQLKFVINKDSVRDFRDDSTMTHDEFMQFVVERTRQMLIITKKDGHLLVHLMPS